MRIAVCSDEIYPLHEVVVSELDKQGHEVARFGSIKSGKEESWVRVAQLAAEAIAFGTCDEGIFFCWTGTGISMAANKVPGIRAALCCDPETARAARIWNHANVLALSNRLMSQERAIEIIQSWLDTPKNVTQGERGAKQLQVLDGYYRKRND